MDELAPARWRMIVALVLTAPMLVMMVPGVSWHLPGWVQALLATPVVFGAGFGFFRRAARQALKGQASMDTLVALGSGVAWAFAMAEWIRGAHHLSFETAAALVAFLLAGKYLEARAKSHATDALKAMLQLAPPTALRIEPDDSVLEVPVALLQPGDRVRVLPGQSIPADGCVRVGEAEVDESMLTGEPLPVAKGPGALLVAGSVVHGSRLDLEISAVGADTQLAHMAALVAQAQGSKAPAQDLADRTSAVFVPVILLLALSRRVLRQRDGAKVAAEITRLTPSDPGIRALRESSGAMPGITAPFEYFIGDSEKARAQCAAGLSIEPNAWDLLLCRALCARSLGEEAAYRESLRATLEASPPPEVAPVLAHALESA